MYDLKIKRSAGASKWCLNKRCQCLTLIFEVVANIKDIIRLWLILMTSIKWYISLQD